MARPIPLASRKRIAKSAPGLPVATPRSAALIPISPHTSVKAGNFIARIGFQNSGGVNCTSPRPSSMGRCDPSAKALIPKYGRPWPPSRVRKRLRFPIDFQEVVALVKLIEKTRQAEETKYGASGQNVHLLHP